MNKQSSEFVCASTSSARPESEMQRRHCKSEFFCEVCRKRRVGRSYVSPVDPQEQENWIIRLNLSPERSRQLKHRMTLRHVLMCSQHFPPHNYYENPVPTDRSNEELDAASRSTCFASAPLTFAPLKTTTRKRAARTYRQMRYSYDEPALAPAAFETCPVQRKLLQTTLVKPRRESSYILNIIALGDVGPPITADMDYFDPPSIIRLRNEDIKIGNTFVCCACSQVRFGPRYALPPPGIERIEWLNRLALSDKNWIEPLSQRTGKLCGLHFHPDFTIGESVTGPSVPMDMRNPACRKTFREIYDGTLLGYDYGCNFFQVQSFFFVEAGVFAAHDVYNAHGVCKPGVSSELPELIEYPQSDLQGDLVYYPEQHEQLSTPIHAPPELLLVDDDMYLVETEPPIMEAMNFAPSIAAQPKPQAPPLFTLQPINSKPTPTKTITIEEIILDDDQESLEDVILGNEQEVGEEVVLGNENEAVEDVVFVGNEETVEEEVILDDRQETVEEVAPRTDQETPHVDNAMVQVTQEPSTSKAEAEQSAVVAKEQENPPVRRKQCAVRYHRCAVCHCKRVNVDLHSISTIAEKRVELWKYLEDDFDPFHIQTLEARVLKGQALYACRTHFPPFAKPEKNSYVEAAVFPNGRASLTCMACGARGTADRFCQMTKDNQTLQRVAIDQNLPYDKEIRLRSSALANVLTPVCATHFASDNRPLTFLFDRNYADPAEAPPSTRKRQLNYVLQTVYCFLCCQTITRPMTRKMPTHRPALELIFEYAKVDEATKKRVLTELSQNQQHTPICKKHIPPAMRALRGRYWIQQFEKLRQIGVFDFVKSSRPQKSAEQSCAHSQSLGC